jgi:phage terminase large subunit
MNDAQKPFRPYGAAKELFYCKEPEVLMVGPAGTGKTIVALNKLHLCLMKYPGSRGLLLRKTRHSLSQSSLVTFESKVVPDGFFKDNCSRSHRQSYVYPNGSELVLGGMDKSEKILSTEYDIIVVDEAIEIEQSDLDVLLSRLRNHKMPYQQIILCCNPSYPTHWIKARADAGQMVELKSTHQDNPSMTAEYLAMLDRMSGVRRLRLRDGIWAAAEGRVYDAFDSAIHVIHKDVDVSDFKQIIGGVDWGYIHAGCMQVWAVDGDGRMYLVREYVKTQKNLDWWIEKAKALTKELGVEVWVCDSAEPANIDAFYREGLTAIKAFKSVNAGINAVQERLVVQKDGKPRLFILDDALQERDADLQDRHKPTCLKEEMDRYVWDGKGKDQPVKVDDDAVDTMRYCVAHIDHLDGSGIKIVG